MSFDSGLFISALTFIAGFAFAGGFSLIAWICCKDSAKKRSARNRLIVVVLVTAVFLNVYYYSFHPYAGVLLPNVYRTIMLVIFATMSFLITKDNWKDIGAED